MVDIVGVQSCPINMDSKGQIIWSWKNLMKNVKVIMKFLTLDGRLWYLDKSKHNLLNY